MGVASCCCVGYAGGSCDTLSIENMCNEYNCNAQRLFPEVKKLNKL